MPGLKKPNPVFILDLIQIYQIFALEDCKKYFAAFRVLY